MSSVKSEQSVKNDNVAIHCCVRTAKTRGPARKSSYMVKTKVVKTHVFPHFLRFFTTLCVNVFLTWWQRDNCGRTIAMPQNPIAKVEKVAHFWAHVLGTNVIIFLFSCGAPTRKLKNNVFCIFLATAILTYFLINSPKVGNFFRFELWAPFLQIKHLGSH